VAGRGRHARDEELFGHSWHASLRTAVDELSWLLSRGYAEPSALKLVGDRHALRLRQRSAVLRCACADEAAARRREHRVDVLDVPPRPVAVDGFNCLITVEAAFAGGLVLRGRDHAHRDLASVHGSYRRVASTPAAIDALGRVLTRTGTGTITWLLDRPVSNSGRLRGLLEHAAGVRGWSWKVVLDDNPDRILTSWEGVVASSDGAVLDACEAWIDLPGAVVSDHDPSPWVLDLG
jgi:hypothetical protein